MLAKHLGHTFVHRHPDCEGMSVVAVGGNDVVIFSMRETTPAATAFLADVEVKESLRFCPDYTA
jgi:hypothetical protein